MKAKDEADNVDSSPAQRSFTVDVSTSDTTPPDTTITDGPSGTIEYNDVAFTWVGSDDVTSPSDIIYSYKLQGYDSSWSSWTTSKSKSYTDLDNGTYTFKVKAKDESGNIDSTPAERIFVINISSDLKTYRITWDIVKKEIQLDNPFYVDKPRLKIGISKDFPFIKIVRKDNPFIKTVKIDEYNLKSINFELTWNDDLTTPVFPYGKDTLTFSIKLPDGAEIYNKKNKGQGTLNFEKNNINDKPTIDTIKAIDEDDTEEKLMKFYNSNWRNKSIKLQVTIKIGELRLLKRIHERGNSFNLNISYEFYKPNITKEDNPPDTRIRSGSFGVINTNKIELKWLGEDDETPVEELMYSYLLQEKDSKSKSSWSCWTSDTSKIFSDLADGDYKFLVRTKDNAGNIDPTPAQQSFTINFEHNRNDMGHNNSIPKNNKNGTEEPSFSGDTESQEAQVPGFEFLSFLLVILIGIFIYKISRKHR